MADTAGTAALTARIARGDEVAFGAFYDAWFDAAYGLARAVSRRDESFCLDVVQEVMARVVRRMPALGSESAVQAWMTTAVARAVVDRVRGEQRRKHREQRAAAARGDATAGDLSLPLLADERAAWLGARLAELPAIERELVRARFADGESVTAVAHAMGIGADAAHGRLRRALERLRRAARAWFDT